MSRNWGVHKSPYEAEVRKIDAVLIVLGGLAGAMCLLAWAATYA